MLHLGGCFGRKQQTGSFDDTVDALLPCGRDVASPLGPLGDDAHHRFLQLLDADAYADVKSIREAMDRRRAPFYLRRTKEAMVYFPERQADGFWAAEPIFTKRIPHTVDFQIDGAEFDLYRDVTRFVKRESARAAAEGEDPRARAIGFLMSLYQRRLASSTYAMRRSLENRARRLEEGLKRAQDLARQAPSDLPDPEELEEMEESERERLEAMLEAVTLAGSADQVRKEVQELRRLAIEAKAVEEAGAEAKLSKFRDLLQKEGFFAHPDQRLPLFTEFKDTRGPTEVLGLSRRLHPRRHEVGLTRRAGNTPARRAAVP
jgi:hypothetical protein